MFVIPDAFKHLEDQLTLVSYISNPVTGFIASTIERQNDIVDMLRDNPISIVAPFDSWQITPHGKIRFTLNGKQIESFIKAKPIQSSSNIPQSALNSINSRNRGWYGPKSYPRFLELSQPKESNPEDKEY